MKAAGREFSCGTGVENFVLHEKTDRDPQETVDKRRHHADPADGRFFRASDAFSMWIPYIIRATKTCRQESVQALKHASCVALSRSEKLGRAVEIE